MRYNAENEKYEQSLLLKQGYYNYQYVVKSPYEKGIDESLIEGTHFETNNDYSIYVYYHSSLEDRDMLIGIKRIKSGVNWIKMLSRLIEFFIHINHYLPG